MSKIAQLVYGFVGIAGMLAAFALCFYVIWWMVMFVVSFIPIVGKRHKHDRWHEMQATGLGSSGRKYTDEA